MTDEGPRSRDQPPQCAPIFHSSNLPPTQSSRRPMMALVNSEQALLPPRSRVRYLPSPMVPRHAFSILHTHATTGQQREQSSVIQGQTAGRLLEGNAAAW